MKEIFDKEDIEDEKERIKDGAITCAKYIALEYEQPICEEIISHDNFDVLPITYIYKFKDVKWFARKFLDNQFVFEEQICNHVIIIDDMISTISKDAEEKIYLGIGDGGYEHVENGSNYAVRYAKCYLDMHDPEIINIIGMLKSGKIASIIGVLEEYGNNGFILKDCKIIGYDHEVINKYAEEAIEILDDIAKEYNFRAYKENKEEQVRKEQEEKIAQERKEKFEKNRECEEKKKREYIRNQLMNICPKCKKECGVTDKFCMECGTKLEPPYVAFIQQVLEIKLKQAAKYDTYYFAPQIPQNIGNNAISAYASDICLEEILALYDTSVRKNGKTGMVFTDSYLYYKQMLCKVYRIKYSDIVKVNLDKKVVYVITEGHSYDIWDHEMENPELFCELLNMIVEMQKTMK